MPCSSTIRAYVCRKLWNVRSSPVGPLRGIPARFIAE